MTIKLIVGLRNPGAAYEPTRHNAGGWFVQAMARTENVPFKLDKKLQSEVASFDLTDLPCKLIMPLTFMNHSGLAVRTVRDFYRLQTSEILVAHDDLDLPAGTIKLKTGGGHGGHNGLRDIMCHLGAQDFHRLRIGIGHPGHRELVLDYVLGKPSQYDKQQILEAIDRAIIIVPKLLCGQISQAMNLLNT
jgi:PTH1 family peptidyl-tRNA hydrolase